MVGHVIASLTQCTQMYLFIVVHCVCVCARECAYLQANMNACMCVYVCVCVCVYKCMKADTCEHIHTSTHSPHTHGNMLNIQIRNSSVHVLVKTNLHTNRWLNVWRQTGRAHISQKINIINHSSRHDKWIKWELSSRGLVNVHPSHSTAPSNIIREPSCQRSDEEPCVENSSMAQKACRLLVNSCRIGMWRCDKQHKGGGDQDVLTDVNACVLADMQTHTHTHTHHVQACMHGHTQKHTHTRTHSASTGTRVCAHKHTYMRAEWNFEMVSDSTLSRWIC